MIRVEVFIVDAGGVADVRAEPKIPKGTKPTALEKAAWEEMKARIFARVAKPRKPGK